MLWRVQHRRSVAIAGRPADHALHAMGLPVCELGALWCAGVFTFSSASVWGADFYLGLNISWFRLMVLSVLKRVGGKDASRPKGDKQGQLKGDTQSKKKE